jgi:hypothetical protein
MNFPMRTLGELAIISIGSVALIMRQKAVFPGGKLVIATQHGMYRALLEYGSQRHK